MQETINGCRVFYQIRPNPVPDAPRVLLLHGWGCDHTVFAPVENALAEGATIVTLDFPGHGRSGEPPVPWGGGEYAAQVAELITQNGLAPVQVIGHSHGGRVALRLAAEYPGLVDRLVITGGAGIRKPETAQSRGRTARYRRYSAFLKRMKDMPQLAAMADRLQTALRNKYGSPDYVKLNENMRRTFVKLVSEDISPLLSGVRAPTLLIWGDADTETPLWMGRKMEKEIPDAGLVVFEGGTHFAFLEQWRRFVLIVKRFIMEDQA